MRRKNQEPSRKDHKDQSRVTSEPKTRSLESLEDDELRQVSGGFMRPCAC